MNNQATLYAGKALKFATLLASCLTTSATFGANYIYTRGEAVSGDNPTGTITNNWSDLTRWATTAPTAAENHYNTSKASTLPSSTDTVYIWTNSAYQGADEAPDSSKIVLDVDASIYSILGNGLGMPSAANRATGITSAVVAGTGNKAVLSLYDSKTNGGSADWNAIAFNLNAADLLGTSFSVASDVNLYSTRTVDAGAGINGSKGFTLNFEDGYTVSCAKAAGYEDTAKNNITVKFSQNYTGTLAQEKAYFNLNSKFSSAH